LGWWGWVKLDAVKVMIRSTENDIADARHRYRDESGDAAFRSRWRWARVTMKSSSVVQQLLGHAVGIKLAGTD
jgi:hypothetical protein